MPKIIDYCQKTINQLDMLPATLMISIGIHIFIFIAFATIPSKTKIINIDNYFGAKNIAVSLVNFPIPQRNALVLKQATVGDVEQMLKSQIQRVQTEIEQIVKKDNHNNSFFNEVSNNKDSLPPTPWEDNKGGTLNNETNANPNQEESLNSNKSESNEVGIDSTQIEQSIANEKTKTVTYEDSKKDFVLEMFILAWQQKIERLGRMNYPKNISGWLRVATVLDKEGVVTSTEVIESSGNQELDEATTKIIAMGSPYQPFTKQMAEEMDKLKIIRTFKFVAKGGQHD